MEPITLSFPAKGVPDRSVVIKAAEYDGDVSIILTGYEPDIGERIKELLVTQDNIDWVGIEPDSSNSSDKTITIQALYDSKLKSEGIISQVQTLLSDLDWLSHPERFGRVKLPTIDSRHKFYIESGADVNSLKLVMRGYETPQAKSIAWHVGKLLDRFITPSPTEPHLHTGSTKRDFVDEFTFSMKPAQARSEIAGRMIALLLDRGTANRICGICGRGACHNLCRYEFENVDNKTLIADAVKTFSDPDKGRR